MNLKHHGVLDPEEFPEKSCHHIIQQHARDYHDSAAFLPSD